MATLHRRRVRSFVRRPGRTTKSQRRALEDLWPRWGIELEDRILDFEAVFGRRAPLVLDIGFGDGEALLTSAANHPEADFVGVEVHEPGIGHLLMLLEQAGLENVRIIARDVIDVIDRMFGPQCFDVVNIFFPDPWPKKRHHKRRLVQRPFLGRLDFIMKPGALLHIATDWPDYAENIETLLESAPEFSRIDHAAAAPLAARPPTKFERRGRRLGHKTADLYYTHALHEKSGETQS
jgi:tRNA (guanine-N7-)-methyltransferase